MHPVFNLYNQAWPIRTATPPLAPAKFVEGGAAWDSIVGSGSIISGGEVRRSVLSPDVRIDAGAQVVMPVEDCFWGDRYGILKDPFGHRWSVATRLKDFSPAQLQQQARSWASSDSRAREFCAEQRGE